MDEKSIYIGVHRWVIDGCKSNSEIGNILMYVGLIWIMLFKLLFPIYLTFNPYALALLGLDFTTLQFIVAWIVYIIIYIGIREKIPDADQKY